MTIMRINVGPIHPSTHGVLKLVVDVDGDRIENITPKIGFLHRGVEKLMETRSYMQNPVYTEKLDYIAPLAWDELYVSAVEAALGKEVKEAAQYARVILLEFQRIASHLLWLGTFANDLGQLFTSFMWAFRERDIVIRFLEDISGSRMFYVNMRVGGLDKQLPADFRERAYGIADYIEEKVLQYPDMLDSNSVFMERTRGVGIITRDNAIGLGVAGPVLRASGVEEDVRKSAPYYIYDKISFRTPVRSEGDSYARYRIRYEEIIESINIIRQALDSMPDGDMTGLPLKLIGPAAKPETVVVSRELPRGEGLIYMVPDKQKPYRVSLRSPAFINLAALSHAAKGLKFADLFAVLGSLDVVMAEIDR
ncbi:MAG: NADH-quinone oxidoreductase subunit D [Candidatus Marsarchaeota archaeon]|jgi:NADH-quinone oxidoreductase subunit D|nr:NADH-quinone oxidoreductase subunit D [Candidatus Marsarchaeota archaeon]